MNLGINLTAQGRANDAVSVFEQALRRDPSAVVHKRYGDALQLSGRLDDAMVQYDAALAQNPEYFQALNEKGNTLVQVYKKGLELDDDLIRSALAVWRQSLAINPRQPRVQASVQQWKDTKLFGR
jgi:tetratricopeptide (TPR) repeat protein